MFVGARCQARQRMAVDALMHWARTSAPHAPGGVLGRGACTWTSCRPVSTKAGRGGVLARFVHHVAQPWPSPSPAIHACQAIWHYSCTASSCPLPHFPLLPFALATAGRFAGLRPSRPLAPTAPRPPRRWRCAACVLHVPCASCDLPYAPPISRVPSRRPNATPLPKHIVIPAAPPVYTALAMPRLHRDCLSSEGAAAAVTHARSAAAPTPALSCTHAHKPADPHRCTHHLSPVQGFLRKSGADASTVTREADAKGVEYVYAIVKDAGCSAAEVGACMPS